MSTDRPIVCTAAVPAWALRTFDDLARLPVNFQPIGWQRALVDPDWRVDERHCRLPTEAPGPPVPGGPFEVARELMCSYELADPAILRAVYDAGDPLEGREMLLVGRFLGLRFPMGVRVSGVVDGPGEEAGVPVQRFAWHYRTLQGHLERGQMGYELIKNLRTGQIDFRIAAYSQRAPIGNPIVRAGFAVFGRSTQLRFYDRALERMQRLTAERAAGRPPSNGPASHDPPRPNRS